ncbi:MAG: acyl-CoA dehydrogenase family protein [Gammaproteobacteria bacterium]
MGHVFRTEQQQAAVDGLKRYLDDKIDPLFRKEYRDSGLVPKEKMREFLKDLAEFGLVSGAVGEAQGGMGIDFLTLTMLFEELCACTLDVATVVLINTFGAKLIAEKAPVPLRERYLPGLLSGELFCSMAFSEPDVGSNVMEIKARGRRDGDHYILSGEKTWISNGSYSDILVCTVRTSDDPRKGLSHFLLDRKEHPYEVRELHKIASNGQSTAQIFLNDLRVPASNMMGNEGDALRNTLAVFERSRVFVAAQGLGLARRALEEAVDYAKQRRQHGKVIAGHQLISAMLAEMATNVDAARLLTYRAAQMVEEGVPAEMEAAMAKYFACEAAVKIARQAVQIHGGNGLTKEFLVERLVRESIITPIPEGTTQIQQLIIGRALTGVNAF